MATYDFSTITPAEALGLTANDTVVMDAGAANATTVWYLPGANGTPDEISVTGGGVTVTFDLAFASAAKTFPDGAMLYVGGPGNDGPITAGATDDGLYGGAGDDTLNAGDGANFLQGNQGADHLSGGAGRDTIYGGQDNDVIDVGASAHGGFDNFAQGNKGSDTIAGSSTDNDTLLGGQGDDLIGATSFSYAFNNGHVTFQITGQSGGGADYLDGNLGNDTVVGGGAGGVMLGEGGNDILYDAGSHNSLDGGVGDDTLLSVAGGDTLSGGDGNDALDASGFGHTPVAPSTLDGGAGDDQLNGGAGADSLIGGDGNDSLDGWAGADTLTGGAGADQFQFYSGEAGTTQGQLDTVLDWESQDHLFFANSDTGDGVGAATSANYVEASAVDYASALSAATAEIHGGTVEYVAVQVGADVVVFADTFMNHTVGSAVLLVGHTLADISASNFDAH